MHVLRLEIVDHQSAVVVPAGEIHAVVRKQPRHDGVTDLAEVAGHDQIIVVRRAPGVGKVRPERLIGGGRHRSAHVVRVRNARVHNRPGRRHGHARSVSGSREDERTRTGHCPLSGRRTHAAVFQRKAVLALSGAKVRACERGGGLGAAAVDEHRGQTDRLSHRRARAVQPEIRRTDAAHGVGRAHALIEQVAGEHVVERLRLQRRFAAYARKALPQHGALGLLPALFAEICVLTDAVKAVAQRTFALFSAHDAGGGADHGRGRKLHGLPSDTFAFHGITFGDSIPGFFDMMCRGPDYVPLYFRRVAMPPRMCRSALLRSSSCRTC